MCKALARTTDLTHMATLKSIEDLQQVYQLPSVWLDHVTTYDPGSVHSGDFQAKYSLCEDSLESLCSSLKQ